jgi:DNA polymerase-3 subunit gamma/tau
MKHDDDADAILDLARRFSPEDAQLYYQIGLIGQRDLPLAPDPLGGFEMVMLRMLAFRPAASVVTGEQTAKPGTPAKPKPEAPAPIPLAERKAQPSDASAEKNASAPQQASGEVKTWPELIIAMRLVGATRELANNCVLIAAEEHRCVLGLDPQRGTHIRTAQTEARLEQALQAYFKRPLKVDIRLESANQETPALQAQRQQEETQRAAELEIEQDENVRALKERFDARIVPGSIKPLN